MDLFRALGLLRARKACYSLAVCDPVGPRAGYDYQAVRQWIKVPHTVVRFLITLGYDSLAAFMNYKV